MSYESFQTAIKQSISLLENDGLKKIKEGLGSQDYLLKEVDKAIHLLRLTANALEVDKQQYTFRIMQNKNV